MAFVVSFISGVWVVFNRFISFRETCDIIKMRDLDNQSPALAALRATNAVTDARTLTLFRVQFVSFLSGSILFSVYIVTSHFERLKYFAVTLLSL